MREPPTIDRRRHALLLDFDGTLVRFAEDPQAVSVDRPALARLMALQEELGGALAVLSGRRIADLDRFLAPLEFAAAGVHGLERRALPGGETIVLAGPQALDGVRERLKPRLAAYPKIRLEDKGTALVLHYRAAPALEGEVRAAMADAVGDRDDLMVMHGNMIVEVHPAGMNKGEALRAFMAAEPFAGRVPIYVGDDTTDEFAFEVLSKEGGIGIKVGEGASAAGFRLKDVAAVHRWLGASVPGPAV